MLAADSRSCSISAAGFEDGLGRRSVRFDREVGGMLECLHLRPELGLFEPQLRTTAADVAALDDERFARVRGFEREGHTLVAVSELVAGERLADVLETRVDAAAVSGLDAAVGFLLQALPALARLHAAGIVHGAVAPGRIIITPTSQVVLLDCVYGAALDRMRLNRRTLRGTLAIVSPPAAGPTRIDARLDVGQVALSALALALGRPVEAEGPAELAPLLDEVTEIAEIRGGERFGDALRLLFISTLPSHVQGRVASAEAAAMEVTRLTRDIGEDAALAALSDLVRYQATALEALPPVPAAAPRPNPVAVVAAPPPAAVTPLAAPAVIAAAPPPPRPSPLPHTAPAPVFTQAPTPVSGPAATVFTAAAPPALAPAPMPVFPALTAPIAPPPPTAPAPAVATPAVPLRIKTEAPPGFAPPPKMRNAMADASPRAVLFVNRAPSDAESRFPWKLAAAVVLVAFVGIVAGRDYLAGRAEPAPPAAEPVAAATTTAALPSGRLSVTTQPAGARVALDGAEVGVTPLTLEGVAPGRHTVTVATDTASVRRTIRIEDGKQLALDIPVFSGWIAVFAPIPLHVAREGKAIGTTDGRIMLPPGRHELTFTNTEFGFSATQSVTIAAGEEAAVNITPKGTVNLNAQPWADVWVDGARVGETPIANLQVPLGTREFVFRHPQFGDRKVTATITMTPSALAVDFSKPPNEF